MGRVGASFPPEQAYIMLIVIAVAAVIAAVFGAVQLLRRRLGHVDQVASPPAVAPAPARRVPAGRQRH